MEVLAEKVEEYRDDEESIKSAVITAQKAADNLKKDAKERVQKMISDSTESAQKTVVAAKERADNVIAEAQKYAATITKEKTDSANEIINKATKQANDALRSARLLAQEIVDEAKDSSRDILAQANERKRFYDEMSDRLKRQSSDFRNNMIEVCEEELRELRHTMDEVEKTKPEDLTKENKTLDSEMADILSSLGEIDSTEYQSEVPGENEVRQYNRMKEAEAEAEAAAAKVSEIPEPQFDIPQPEEEEEDVPETSDIGVMPQDLGQEEPEIEEEPATEEVSEEPEKEEIPVEETAHDVTPDEYMDVNDILNSFTSADAPEETEETEVPPVHDVEVNPEESDEIKFVEREEPAEAEPQPVKKEEPKDDGKMPFENFFDIDTSNENTSEKLSLKSPEEEEEDEEDEEEEDTLKHSRFGSKRRDRKDRKNKE